jgi:hypothetical protein
MVENKALTISQRPDLGNCPLAMGLAMASDAPVWFGLVLALFLGNLNLNRSAKWFSLVPVLVAPVQVQNRFIGANN